ncbi:putative sodium-coupled neutral amino acid transporter 6 [Ciona intestinalis]
MGDFQQDYRKVLDESPPPEQQDNLDEEDDGVPELDPLNSFAPLNISEEVDKLSYKDHLSSALSVFNLMNAILGSGILGLAEAQKNIGVLPFVLMLVSTACLALFTISLLLHLSRITGVKTYEGLAQRSFGKKGKFITSIMIVFHCMGAICSYVFIMKNELPEVIKVFVSYEEKPGEDLPFYLNGNFLMLIVVVGVIVPLSTMKDIKFLGYSSAFGMFCMMLFTVTVIAKKFSIPCPLPLNNTHSAMANRTYHEEQYCSAKVVNLNTRSAYAVPTMFFSFMCHASMLPIYAELRKPSLPRMQKVAAISILNVLLLYLTSATLGYLTFYNRVESELLLTYSLYNPDDPLIVISRLMVIICVMLSVPLLHYPARKTIILSMFPNPDQFFWWRHILVMIGVLSVSVVFVLFVPNIRDIFGIAGATSSASLLAIFPSAFFIRLTGKDATPSVRSLYSGRRKIAWVLVVLGSLFMILSVALIVLDWLT